jgi:hypothetical protein
VIRREQFAQQDAGNGRAATGQKPRLPRRNQCGARVQPGDDDQTRHARHELLHVRFDVVEMEEIIQGEHDEFRQCDP